MDGGDAAPEDRAAGVCGGSGRCGGAVGGAFFLSATTGDWTDHENHPWGPRSRELGPTVQWRVLLLVCLGSQSWAPGGDL